jgi:importin subunit alpha-1
MSGNSIILSLVMATDNCYCPYSFLIRLLNIHQPANMSLLNNVVWTVSNLCRGKPAPDMALISPAIEPLVALLHKEVSTDVLVDAVWALSYMSDGPNEQIESVMRSGAIPKLIDFLEDKSSPLLVPTIRCLGNFVTGSDQQTQAVLDAGILNHLSQLLDSSRVRLTYFIHNGCDARRKVPWLKCF